MEARDNLANYHNPDNSEQEGSVHPCEICGLSFTSAGILALHKRSHPQLKKLFCDICGKYFSDDSTFSIHKTVHTEKKLYECEI